jgi:glycosyltransferase involved in cell wall biosynthesis
VNSERGFSGGEVQVLLLLEGLRKLGHQPVLFCPPKSRSFEEAVRRNLPVVATRMRNDFDWPAIVALVRGFRHCGADLVHLHTGRANWLGGLAAWLVGLPAITTRRMDRVVKRNWRTRLIYRHLVQRALPISPAVAACLIEGGVPAERIALIAEGVDPRQLQPRAGREETRAARGATADEHVLLALSALVHRKGLDVLLEALALLAADGLPATLWIAGDGPERATLAAHAARLGLDRHVQFLGQRQDGPDLLAACDVFVMPSRREGLGVAALEAMAAGRPVVCSAVGGLTFSVVDGRTGLLVPPDDPRALAAAIARLLRDDALRHRLGAAGPGRIAEGFLTEQVVAAHEQLYRTVLREWKA